MSPKPIFLLLRHLPTTDDAAGLLTPHDATTELEPIDELALRKLARAIDRLATDTCRHLTITSSQTDRGRVTGEELARCLASPVKIDEDVRLGNIDQGSIGGITQDEFSRSPLYWRWHTLPHMTTFPKGEALLDVVGRIDELIAWLSSKPTVNLVISHTTPLQVMLSRLLGLKSDRIWSFYFAYYTLTAVYGDTLIALNSAEVSGRWITQLRE